MPQETNSSTPHIAIDVANKLSAKQEPLVTEECSSNHLWEWEMHDVHSGTQDLPSIKKECLQEWEMYDDYSGTQKITSIKKEAFVPMEDVIPCVLSIVKTEYEEVEEKAETELDNEGCSSSEDCLNCSTFSIEKSEHSVDREAEMEDNLEELNQEIASASGDNEPQSTTFIGMEEHRNDDSSVITTVSQKARGGQSFHCTTKQEVSCGNNKTFKQEATLKQRSQLHSVLRTYSCSVCEKIFRDKSNLRQHLRVHSGEHPYSCTICNRSFTSKTSLNRHSMLHSGERPFSCIVCNKTFTHKVSLKRHSMLHSGERPFSCSICTKTFRVKFRLKEHLMLHSGERPFSCSICNKTFRQRSKLQRHSQLHTAEC